MLCLIAFAALVVASAVSGQEPPKKDAGDAPPVRTPDAGERVPDPLARRLKLPDAGNMKFETPAAVPAPKFPYKPVKATDLFSAFDLPKPAALPAPEVGPPKPGDVRRAPENQVRICNNFLNALAAQNVAGVEFLRFFSLYNTTEAYLASYKALLNFWVNQLTRSPTVHLLIEVPDSDGRLLVFDIRWFGWSAEAAADVFSREPFFREPLVLEQTAAAMRALLGLTEPVLPDGAKDEQFRHAFGVVRGDWFLIETGEALRSPAYYDLLFAKERYVAATGTPKKTPRKQYRLWPGGKYKAPAKPGEKAAEGDGEDFPPGAFLVVSEFQSTAAVTKVDFPKDEDEWNKAFGIDKIIDFGKEQDIFLDNGAVVDGMEVAGGSIVARQNRLLLRKPTPIGYYWKTFDTNKTTGRTDYFQTLHRNPDFVAGEVITRLPNGGQTYGLFLKDKKRAEEVAPDLAIDRTDPFDYRVRNPGSCVVCHANGIISPEDVVGRWLRAGGEIKNKSDKDREEIEAYFQRMGNKITLDQNSYADFVRETTGTDPAFNAKNYAASRNWYKSSVGVEQAALELGMGKLELQLLAARSIQARTSSLALDRGFPVPRTKFDEEVFPELTLLAAVFRATATDGKAATLEELIDKALERYGVIRGQVPEPSAPPAPAPAPGAPVPVPPAKTP